MAKFLNKAMEAIGMEIVEEDEMDSGMEDSIYNDVKVVEARGKRKIPAETEKTRGSAVDESPAQAFISGDRKKIPMMKMFLVEPENFDQVREIADLLKEKRGVVVNLEEVEYEDARKIIDFLSGNIYALGGTVHKISSGIILFAPDTLEVENMQKKRERSFDRPGKRPEEQQDDLYDPER